MVSIRLEFFIEAGWDLVNLIILNIDYNGMDPSEPNLALSPGELSRHSRD